MLTILTGDLPSTATYAARSWVWVSNGSGFVTIDRTTDIGEVVTETIPALGKLTIKQQFRHRRFVPCDWNYSDESFGQPTYRALKPMTYEVDTYAVQEFPAEYPGTRMFALVNLTDPSQERPYEVWVGGVSKCSCIAGNCKTVSDKHVEALTALLEAGGLEQDEAVMPACRARRLQVAG